MAKSTAPRSAMSDIAAVVVTTAPAPVTNIVSPERIAARDESATAATSSYGATKRYASLLVDELGHNFWRKDSPKYAEWQQERKDYDASLKAKNHPNPSVAHKRLMAAADEICNPKEGGAKGKVSFFERTKKEALALHSALLREEEKVGLDATEKKILSALVAYMSALGIDPAKKPAK